MHARSFSAIVCCVALVSLSLLRSAAGQTLEIEAVDGQPLAANTKRLLTAMEFLGAPLNTELTAKLQTAIKARDAEAIQKLLDPHVLLQVSLNPEVRVKVTRGPAKANTQQHGFTPHLVKVVNHSTVTRQLRVFSPQSGPVYSGPALGILKRQAQTELKENENIAGATDRFLQVEMFQSPPMTANLSGLEVEYAILLVYSSESGRREATIAFDVGAGTQDIGFRGEAPVLFDVQPAIPVQLSIRDHDGRPTTARLLIRDREGRVYPPQAKRLAPDFFFQPHIYRADGDVVLLPPGEFTVQSSRGPEYLVRELTGRISRKGKSVLSVRLERWIDPMQFGYFVGDHHIHGAGCSHYDSPTQGVRPEDMFQQVKGEGLNVGCVLTWGPCFDFQRQYFSPQADEISEPLTVLKYDLEISGFGSAAMGHVCLLNLRDQTYPGSEGTKTKGWPSWTVPVMRWCKEQGGVTGYPHSAMHVNPSAGAKRWIAQHDRDGDGLIIASETESALLPLDWSAIDEDRNGSLDERELQLALHTAADQLPNYAVPEMNGAGAMEVFVTTPAGVCDFISAMDTARIPEWNTWYHLMNCGFPLKLSGETDFPCMSSRRVGQGRVYVQLGEVKQLDFTRWCEGLAAGRSYVSDGFAHAIDFRVNGVAAGEKDIQLAAAGEVSVSAEVAFAPQTPKAVAYGLLAPPAGPRMSGDTVNLHAPRNEDWLEGGERRVEIVVNGVAVKSFTVPADGQRHRIEAAIPLEHSSWVAVRQFPQLHTNPVSVIVNQKPIRASRRSALWCAEATKLLWKNRHTRIKPQERAAAKKAYDQAIETYLQIAAESVAP